MSLFIPYEHYSLVFFYGATILILNMYQFFARGIYANDSFVISGLLSNILEVIFNLIFVIIFKLGVASILISASLAKIIGVIYLEQKLKALKRFDWNVIQFKVIKEMIKYASPLAINSIAFWGMSNINRIIAYKYLESNANGYLAVANKFTSIVSIFIVVYILAWQEQALEKSSSEDRSEYYSAMLSRFYLILAIVTSSVLFMTKIVFPWFIDSTYHPAMITIPLSFISSYASGISSFFGPLFGAEKKTNIIFYSTVIGAIINIGTLILLLPKIGICAVPISLGIGFSVNSISRYFWLNKYIRIKHDNKSFLGSIMIITISSIIAQFLNGIIYSVIGIGVLFTVLIILFRKDLNLLIERLKFKISTR